MAGKKQVDSLEDRRTESDPRSPGRRKEKSKRLNGMAEAKVKVEIDRR